MTTSVTLQDVRARAAARSRVKIRPTVIVEAKTPEQKRLMTELVKRVIHEHWDVLMALKNR